MPISCPFPPHHCRGADVPLVRQLHCEQSRWAQFTSIQPPPVWSEMCSKSNLLAPCAQQPVRHACCLPFNTAQNPAVAGVYTAPHANETKCDQSLTLELKIPLVGKKRESNKPVLVRTRRERESQRQLKKMLKDLPVLQDNLCTLRFFLFFF